MATTTNYAWTTPDNSGLVKNGAQDIRTLGSAVDTSLWNVGFGQAGKNKIINGDFGIWQRGTSFNPAGTGFFYAADRWQAYVYAASATTVSRQSFTAGTAPVAGYESSFFMRGVSTNTAMYFKSNMVEDVRTLAGQPATFSFWAKSASAQTLSQVTVAQNFGSGGSGSVNALNTNSLPITTNWARYTITGTIPSISGKTIGTGSFLSIEIVGAINNALDIWGVQLEAGSVATPFQTATGTLAGEYALAQRYYVRFANGGAYSAYGYGNASSTTVAYPLIALPVAMRIAPSTLEYSNLQLGDTVNAGSNLTALTVQFANPQQAVLEATVASGLTQYRNYQIRNANSTAGYLGFSAEL